ncbi:MAG: GNAT family N-acetyltransferase, partial [Candidatus Limnocylindria bacterium]
MSTQTDAGAGAPTLAGLRLRPYAGESDLPELVRLENAENEADGLNSRVTVEELRALFTNPSEQFDPERDVTIAEIDGQMVGFANREWVDTNDGALREYRTGGVVDPAWRRRGIGSALLAENRRAARELAATHQNERGRAMGSFTGEHQAGAIALMVGAGYQAVRYFFDMERPTLEDIPDLPLPDGLEVRPITPDLYRRVWDADVEAFRDHWGGFDASEASFRRYADGPDFDPSLWLIAFDGEEVAGGVINTIYPAQNQAHGVKRGWLDSVFTRRAWRRRGLARALIAGSLARLRESGMTSAMLGVDADNPHAALGLYESAGFVVTQRNTAWR